MLLVVEQRFLRTPDGKVWTAGHYSYEFLQRYATHADQILVLGRIIDVCSEPLNSRPSSGPMVNHVQLPNYNGLLGLIASFYSISKGIFSACGASDIAIIRAPSVIGSVTRRIMQMQKKSVGVEVIGDPFDVFAPGVFHHPLRCILRHASQWMLLQDCRSATAVCYVTKTTLQDRYPTDSPAFGVSDCELPSEAYATKPRLFCTPNGLKLVHVGTMSQQYKGQDLIMEAMRRALNIRPEMSLSLELVGDGKYRSQFEKLANTLGLEKYVTFHGFVGDSNALRQILDDSDLLVFPSRTEGLPRSIIEAMARGLPCIASRVGGIHELIDKEYLVPSNDANALSELIVRLAFAPCEMKSMSEKNYSRSHEFAIEPSRNIFKLFLEAIVIH